MWGTLTAGAKSSLSVWGEFICIVIDIVWLRGWMEGKHRHIVGLHIFSLQRYRFTAVWINKSKLELITPIQPLRSVNSTIKFRYVQIWQPIVAGFYEATGSWAKKKIEPTVRRKFTFFATVWRVFFNEILQICNSDLDHRYNFISYF